MRYVLQRLGQLAIVLVAVTFLTSTAMRFLPGGADGIIAVTKGAGANPEEVARIKRELGLDRNVVVQWLSWTKDLVTFEWGNTLTTNQSIVTTLQRSLPVSLYLMFYGQLIALGLAIPVAIWSAYRQNSVFDRAATTVAFAGLAAPNYIIAPVLILLFCVQRKWIPFPSTYAGLWDRPLDHFKAFILPSVTIAIPLFAGYMRLLRADLINTLQSDFITTARAKGVSTFRLLFGHALRPSLFSLITAAAVNIGALVGGVFIVEGIFDLNGMGGVTVQSIFTREYTLVQYGVAIIAVIYVLVNFMVDVSYGWLDPRVRAGRALS
jgi:peptide/nickel transport system permease protein